MSTQQTARTQYVDVEGIKFAYRRFGHRSDVPLVFLMHFRGTMDHWDPALINSLALTRELILLDNSGVGKSGGEIPDNYPQWADNVIALMAAIGLKRIDLLGWSMGGIVAQFVAIKAPKLVRRLLLPGTMPTAGEGVVPGPPEPFQLIIDATTEAEIENGYMKTYFTLNAEKQKLGKESWDRIHERKEERTSWVAHEGAERQVAAAQSIFAKGLGGGEGTYDRLGEITMPVFVANGEHDVLTPTSNSFVLQKLLPDAYLHIYPDAGHGFLFQYASLFVQHVNIFLDN